MIQLNQTIKQILVNSSSQNNVVNTSSRLNSRELSNIKGKFNTLLDNIYNDLQGLYFQTIATYYYKKRAELQEAANKEMEILLQKIKLAEAEKKKVECESKSDKIGNVYNNCYRNIYTYRYNTETDICEEQLSKKQVNMKSRVWCRDITDCEVSEWCVVRWTYWTDM